MSVSSMCIFRKKGGGKVILDVVDPVDPVKHLHSYKLLHHENKNENLKNTVQAINKMPDPVEIYHNDIAYLNNHYQLTFRGVVGVSAYHHYSCEFEPRSWRGVLHTALCDNFCHRFATGRSVVFSGYSTFPHQ